MQRRKRSDLITIFQIGSLKLDIKFAVTDETGMEGDAIFLAIKIL